jgi:hypothetical protein
MELSWLLDPRTYQEELEISEIEAHHRAYTIRAYLKFNLVFNDRQVILMDGEPCEPMDAIFEYTFHKFAITIYKYKLQQTSTGQINPIQLRHNIFKHIECFRP